MPDATVFGTVTFPFSAYVTTDYDVDEISAEQLFALLGTYEQGFADLIVSDDEYRATAYTDRGRVVISSVVSGHANQ